MTSYFDAMDNETDRQVEIFTKALELPLEDRQAYLEQACAGDEDLRRKVEELISVHQRAKGFMEDLPLGLEAGKARTIQIGEQPGDRIDRYKLLQQIGEGGFGTVFMAEQDQPIKLLMAEKKDSEAEQLLDTTLTPAVLEKRKSTDLLMLRAGLKARRGRWQDAADDGLLAFRSTPDGGHYAIIGALVAKTQNHAVYEQYCRTLLSMYGNTASYLTADDVAKACLFLPDEKVDLNTVSRLADETVILGSNDEAAMPFLGLCKALSEYRRGNYGEAAFWAHKSLDSPRLDAHGFASAVLAMADWKLHKENDARAMLAAGEILAPPSMPKSAIEDPGTLWLFWLYARFPMDEAENLIQGGATAGNEQK